MSNNNNGQDRANKILSAIMLGPSTLGGVLGSSAIEEYHNDLHPESSEVRQTENNFCPLDNSSTPEQKLTTGFSVVDSSDTPSNNVFKVKALANTDSPAPENHFIAPKLISPMKADDQLEEAYSANQENQLQKRDEELEKSIRAGNSSESSGSPNPEPPPEPTNSLEESNLTPETPTSKSKSSGSEQTNELQQNQNSNLAEQLKTETPTIDSQSERPELSEFSERK
ncbi:MAG: hypothetical protein SVX43_16025 [Cyanobacteriota bacterium]|nr:hypothetical protein [Cyanobacteriota bacterium]